MVLIASVHLFRFMAKGLAHNFVLKHHKELLLLPQYGQDDDDLSNMHLYGFKRLDIPSQKLGEDPE